MSSSYLTMCISCKEQVRPRQEGLQCDGCLRWQHRTCHTGVSQADYRNAVKTGASIDWRCLTCDFPQAESSLSILSTDILESEEFNPPADSSDQLTEPSTIDTSSESAVGIEGSTVHEPPIQPTIDESTIEGPTPQAVEEVDQPLTFQIMEGAFSLKGVHSTGHKPYGERYNLKLLNHWLVKLKSAMIHFILAIVKSVKRVHF